MDPSQLKISHSLVSMNLWNLQPLQIDADPYLVCEVLEDHYADHLSASWLLWLTQITSLGNRQVYEAGTQGHDPRQPEGYIWSKETWPPQLRCPYVI